MAIFAVLHISAFTYKVYVPEDRSRTTQRWKLVVDAFNFVDFVREFWKACKWILIGRKKPETNEFEFVEDDGMISFLKASYRSKYGIEVADKPNKHSQATSREGSTAHPTFVFPWAVTLDKDSKIDLRDLPSPSEPKMRVLLTRSRSSSVKNSSVPVDATKLNAKTFWLNDT